MKGGGVSTFERGFQEPSLGEAWSRGREINEIVGRVEEVGGWADPDTFKSYGRAVTSVLALAQERVMHVGPVNSEDLHRLDMAHVAVSAWGREHKARLEGFGHDEEHDILEEAS